MSLNPEEKQHVAKELRENFKHAGLTPEVIQADLAFSHEQYEEAIKLGPTTDEEAVSRLRNYLAEKLEEQGKEPYSGS
ncbi:hypothetical protein GCM10011351_25360 [Paraliobacillus quinghaiensis]|uniref:DUF2316 family protein n=1 Tax=Paraliobacillus quinghaiensis TaxID=470815 RepID=A0A917TUG4_9BACI|nr:DUF2316 family protein [Paraliobacillus quinghaiensis]GGM38120.1 hypothetical protein GCM10011351_25360 [Paraliobacillus quinghaiensis]